MEEKKTMAQKDYEEFLNDTMNNKIPYDLLKVESGIIKMELKGQIKELEIMRDHKGKEAIEIFLDATGAPPFIHELYRRTQSDLIYNFLNWVDQKTDDLFYLLTIHREKGAFFFNRDFTVMFCLQICSPIECMDKYVKEDALHLHNITSIKKGNGQKVMKEIIEFAMLHNVPVTLWTETEETAAYFEKYGFKNCGQLGEYDDYFMILYP